MAAPAVQATGASNVVTGGTAASVLTFDLGYNVISLDLAIGYDPAKLGLSASDVTVGYGGATYSLASFVTLLDGYDGVLSPSLNDDPSSGLLALSFFGIGEVPNSGALTFTSNFRLLALPPGTTATVDYSGSTAYDSNDLGYTGDPFAVGAQFSAPVPEPQSVALMLCGVAVLAAAQRRRRPVH